MGADRVRVVVAALACVAGVVASALVLDWFVIRTGGVDLGITRMGIDLRSINACASNGMCVSASFSKMTGNYPTFAALTFWSSLVLAAIVVVQAGARVLQGQTLGQLSKVGHAAALAAFLGALLAGYFFGPDTGTAMNAEIGLSVKIVRTAAPLVMLGASLAGALALYFADAEATEVVVAPPQARAIPPARAARTTTPPPTNLELRYATLSAEISRAGIDARRADGQSRLVMWSDVVGAVARRLPAAEPYAGAPFVDLVSTAGATLRILPWTKLAGDVASDGEPDARLRALVKLARTHQPALHLDAATRAFVDDGVAPVQLPDAAVLAEHDERLA